MLIAEMVLNIQNQMHAYNKQKKERCEKMARGKITKIIEIREKFCLSEIVFGSCSECSKNFVVKNAF